ncbi:MAG: translocation/assembly module TamB, partial [Gemmatimonadota bacterium]|nr:translocation/assembly module TamB [Gemmatimonadota bacterium]
MEPAALDGTWTVRLPQQVVSGRPASGRVVYRPKEGSGPWELDFTHGEGVAEGRGTAKAAWGPAQELEVERLVLRELDLASLAGDTIPSRLSASFGGRIEGAPGPDLVAALDFLLTEGTWGGRSLPAASGSGRLRDARAQVSIRSDDPDLQLELDASILPFQDPPVFAVERGRFLRLDPSFALEDPPMAVSLNGSFEGRFEGLSVETGSGVLSVRLDSSNVADQVISEGSATATLVRGTLDGRVSLSYPGGRADAEAGAEFGDGGWQQFSVASLAFEGVDVGRFMAGEELSTSLTGNAQALLTRQPGGGVAGTASLRITPSTINHAELTAGALEATLASGRLGVEGLLEAGAGTVLIAGSALVDSARTSEGQARIEFDVPELGPLLAASSPVSARGRAAIRALAPATQGWAFEASISQGAWGDLEVDTMAVAGRWTEGQVDIDTLSLDTSALSARGGGLIAFEDDGQVTPSFVMQAELTDAQPLAPFLKADVLEVGTARAETRLRRSPDGLVLEGEAEANAVLMDGVRIVGLSGEWSVTGPRFNQIDSARAGLNIQRVTSPAEIEVARTDVDLHYDGDVLALEVTAGIDETRDAELRAVIDPQSRGRRLEVERFRFSIDQDVWRLTDRVQVDLMDGLVVGPAELLAGNQRIAFAGGLHPTRPDSFNLSTAAFRVGTVSDLIGFPGVEATVTSDLVSTGSLSEPSWEWSANALMQHQGRDRGSLTMDLSYRNDRLQAEVGLEDAGSNAVSVQGFVPLHLDFTDPERFASEAAGEVDLRAQADSFDVQWFVPFLDPAVVSGLRGALSVDATVGGRSSDPVLAGRTRFWRGSVSFPRLGTEYRRIDAAFELDGQVVTLANASLDDGNGSATVSGSLELESLALGRFDLTAALDQFLLISNTSSRARASGQLHLRGTTQRPSVEGNVEVVSADAYLQGQSTQRDLETVELTPEDYEMLRETFGYRPPEVRTDYGALASALAADIDVTIGRDTWLRQRMNPELAVQLSGELAIEKAPDADPRIVGTITPISG